jgi:hypothetical protein
MRDSNWEDSANYATRSSRIPHCLHFDTMYQEFIGVLGEKGQCVFCDGIVGKILQSIRHYRVRLSFYDTTDPAPIVSCNQPHEPGKESYPSPEDESQHDDIMEREQYGSSGLWNIQKVSSCLSVPPQASIFLVIFANDCYIPSWYSFRNDGCEECVSHAMRFFGL